jgi:hypothetical protein
MEAFQTEKILITLNELKEGGSELPSGVLTTVHLCLFLFLPFLLLLSISLSFFLFFKAPVLAFDHLTK